MKTKKSKSIPPLTIFRNTYEVTSSQNVRMRDQISLLVEKLEFFIERVKNEQGKTKRGEYFTMKDDEFRGKFPFPKRKILSPSYAKMA
jgi:hypothetical protein